MFITLQASQEVKETLSLFFYSFIQTFSKYNYTENIIDSNKGIKRKKKIKQKEIGKKDFQHLQ